MSDTTRQRETLYGIFGGAVGHSLSPAMHNAAFAAIGFPGRYLAFDVAPEPFTSLTTSGRSSAAAKSRDTQ